MNNFIYSLIGFVLGTSADWAIHYFGMSCFEQIIFHLKVPLEGTNTQFIKDWFKKCFFKSFIFSCCIWLGSYLFKISFYEKLCKFILVSCIIFGLFRVGIIEFIVNQFCKTNLYENYYVDSRNVNIKFPKKKRNLILIYVESLETTYTSKENGGNYHSDLIKELTDLGKQHLNFSHQNKLGGAHVVCGTGWTTGGLVAQSAGIPLLVPFTHKPFSQKNLFYPNVYTLGDILKKEGYQQEFLIGSDAIFGGREFYYKQHGDFKIFDVNTAYKLNKIPHDYHEFWGYEDEKLFEYAKEEITKLAKNDQPFHLTMLTVDTHHPYGYVDKNYENQYKERLSNVIKGSSYKIGEFVDWLKQQPFYDDTTIIISGDHTSMAAEYINHTYDKKYERTIFNVFIHSVKNTYHNKNRLFTSFDMFPTILDAIGAKIENDCLGLGVSLFSNKKTIAEQIGLKTLNRELKKQSSYYKNHILK